MKIISTLILLFSLPAFAGSAVPGYGVEEYELYNDQGGIAILCDGGKIYTVLGSPAPWTSPRDGGQIVLPAGAAVVKCKIEFAWKTGPYKIIFQPPDRYHGVNGAGGPVDILDIWDDGHHTSTNAMVGLWLAPSDLQNGQPAGVIATSGSGGSGPLYIDAR